MNIRRIKEGLRRRFFDAKKRFFLIWLKITRSERPSSYPYISADSFRALSDHVFDFIGENEKIQKVKEGDIIYVNSDDIEKFFRQIHAKIESRYILISHWGIKPVDDELLKFVDDKIIHWFAKNALVKHPKLTPIPVGLEDLHRYNAGIPSEFEKLRKRNVAKKEKILYDFKIATNESERLPAGNFLVNFADAEKPKNKLPIYDYHKLLQEYMFVASPPGAGRECHRTWEAIYLGTIPIVRRSVCEEYFENLGAPMWIINDWQELNGVDLQKKYQQIIRSKRNKIIWMDYWIKIIENKKNGK